MDFYINKFNSVEEVKSALDVIETEKALKLIKDHFEDVLAKNLNLTRVSAPLFVKKGTGFNDDLNGVEKQVECNFKSGITANVVQSLAKWKRYALHKYKFEVDTGLYTDMNAIRCSEDLSNIHSYYVDQWDWEKVIREQDRTLDYLKSVVIKIYQSLVDTDKFIRAKYNFLTEKLPKDIIFMTSQELEDKYPNLTPKEREYKASKEHGAIFIMQIGKKLKSNQTHDGRAPDYDDWDLNGDIILYYPLLDIPFELSSMGIRVTKESLQAQLKESKCEEKKNLTFHKMLLNGELPFTIGGGIGQSRICMFLLDKTHIGEVQVSVWDEETIKYCEVKNIKLL